MFHSDWTLWEILGNSRASFPLGSAVVFTPCRSVVNYVTCFLYCHRLGTLGLASAGIRDSFSLGFGLA